MEKGPPVLPEPVSVFQPQALTGRKIPANTGTKPGSTGQDNKRMEQSGKTKVFPQENGRMSAHSAPCSACPDKLEPVRPQAGPLLSFLLSFRPSHKKFAPPRHKRKRTQPFRRARYSLLHACDRNRKKGHYKITGLPVASSSGISPATGRHSARPVPETPLPATAPSAAGTTETRHGQPGLADRNGIAGHRQRFPAAFFRKKTEQGTGSNHPHRKPAYAAEPLPANSRLPSRFRQLASAGHSFSRRTDFSSPWAAAFSYQAFASARSGSVPMPFS